MATRKKIPLAELAECLKKHNGDRDAVAEELGLTKKYVSKRIVDTPHLRALWTNTEPISPDSVEAETRSAPHKSSADPISDKRDIEVWQANGKDVFMEEISSMLHDKENINKLDIFKGFEGNVGLHMARALEMTQNVNMRQNITLFEVAENLRDQILGGHLDEESEILKTRLYVACCEQQGKFYDRLLRGLEAMLKMTEKEKGNKKKKAGFRPLSELEKAEDASK